jgi:hypothetical protein
MLCVCADVTRVTVGEIILRPQPTKLTAGFDLIYADYI